MSRTCLRNLRTSRPYLIPQTRNLYNTPAPLHLDFLAPSWRSPSNPQVRLPQRRDLSSTQSKYVRAITNPRTDDSGSEMLISITPRAAHRLTAIASKDSNPDLALRVSVESGGCHGFQYLMSLTSTKEVDGEEDTIFENEEAVQKDNEGGYRAKVVMDEPSLELLKGSSVDYTMELIGSQFKVTGIPGAKSSCGCGTSFDIQ